MIEQDSIPSLSEEKISFYIFAELSGSEAAFFYWDGTKLQRQAISPEPLAAWRKLGQTLRRGFTPALAETPLGPAWAWLHQEGEHARALVLQPRGISHSSPERRDVMALLGALALTTLRLQQHEAECAYREHIPQRQRTENSTSGQAAAAQSLAHTFSNLIMAVQIQAEMGLAACSEEKKQAALAEISRLVDCGVQVVQDIGTFCNTGVAAALELLDLGQFVQLIVPQIWRELAHRRAPGRDYSWHIACGDNLYVLAEPDGLRQILTHVLANALEAMPAGGPIRIACERDGDYALLCVADSGAGLSEEARVRALQPFFTTKGPEHLGLGLSIVQGLVTRYGGHLTMDISEWSGLAVFIRLPIANPRAVREAKRQAAEAISGPPLPALRLLIVEDDPALRETLVAALTDSGHVPQAVSEGRQAVAALRRQPPFDALVVDLVLPDMDGWKVAYYARKLQPQAAIILLTGWGAPPSQSAEARADLILTKPIGLAALERAISRVVSRRRIASCS